MKIVLCWYFGYATSSNLTFFAYARGRLFRGHGGTRPLNNWSGGVNGIVSPKCMVFVSNLSVQVLCLRFLLGELTAHFYADPPRGCKSLGSS